MAKQRRERPPEVQIQALLQAGDLSIVGTDLETSPGSVAWGVCMVVRTSEELFRGCFKRRNPSPGLTACSRLGRSMLHTAGDPRRYRKNPRHCAKRAKPPYALPQ